MTIIDAVKKVLENEEADSSIEEDIRLTVKD